MTTSEIERKEFELADAIILNNVTRLKHLLDGDLLAVAPNCMTSPTPDHSPHTK